MNKLVIKPNILADNILANELEFISNKLEAMGNVKEYCRTCKQTHN